MEQEEERTKQEKTRLKKSEDIIQADMVLRFHNTIDIKDKALVEITYATLITIENVKDKKVLQKIILVEVPKEVYPKAFEIFSFLLNHSGLPKMNIKKDIDFEKLYDEQVVGKKLS